MEVNAAKEDATWEEFLDFPVRFQAFNSIGAVGILQGDRLANKSHSSNPS